MAFLGVDTGGTFTDFLLQQEDGSLRLHKVLSTPDAPERAILAGIRELGIEVQGLTMTHGSTVATNAILEGKGVKTAYITNTGFADVLSIGRQARRSLYDLTPVKRSPIVPEQQCLQVDSRLSAQAENLQQLSAEKLDTLLEALRELAPDAVAINLLFSFLDDTEERKIEQAIGERFGDTVFISRSSDVLPEYKEYERGMTTTLNAMVGPLMQRYLERLQRGVDGSRISIMQSSAGTTSVDYAGRYPVHLLLSGPAGGLIGAKAVAEDKRLLTFDMGGTSTDVSIIDDDIRYSHQAEIAGYPVAVPMIDMHTIGAGGGSIAMVDDAGLLLVGPQSAGASPGPACYGKGGVRPTVTDANVVLGRLQAQSFLGGGLQLDSAAAERSVQTIAEKLGVDLVEAASGIIDVVNDHMVRALRVMSVQRGEDPKRYTLVSFGGAGGLHVCALAEALGMQKALVPVYAGVLSALGMLAAQQARERSRSINVMLGDCDSGEVDTVFTELMEQTETELLQAVSQQSSAIRFIKTVDVRYAGQSHCLALEWQGLQNMEQAFHLEHESTYGHKLNIDIELVNVRVRAIAEDTATDFVLPEWAPTERYREQAIVIPALDQEVKMIPRMGLQVGQTISGPALITETSATTWLAPGWCAVVDEKGNLQLSCHLQEKK